MYKVEPIQVIIDISGKCNAKCPFCIRQLADIKYDNFMPKKMFYKIMKQIKEIKSVKIISLAAYGEPLLHPDFDEFVDYLSKLNYNILVITNMSLAHNHFDSLLKLTHIMFSLEGHNKESYKKFRKNLSFEKVYENIKEFNNLIQEKRNKNEKTPSRAINFTVTRNSNIKEFYKLWHNYADVIHLNRMTCPLEWNIKNKQFEQVVIKELESEIIPQNQIPIRNNCLQPFKIITIRPDGKLGLCCNDSGNGLDFGNYKNIDKSFYENKNLNIIREELIKNKIHICKNCSENFNQSEDYLLKYLPEINNLIETKKI